ncbi:hypothetical protein GGD61_000707 [Bradyrhizobium sp. SBR1B]|nr:hypothetical protein [Bradyrhizobium sp. SBR1B]
MGVAGQFHSHLALFGEAGEVRDYTKGPARLHFQVRTIAGRAGPLFA